MWWFIKQVQLQYVVEMFKIGALWLDETEKKAVDSFIALKGEILQQPGCMARGPSKATATDGVFIEHRWWIRFLAEQPVIKDKVSIEQHYISLQRLIVIYRMFFLIKSSYIILVWKDHKTNGVLELLMWLIANLQRAAHKPESCQRTSVDSQKTFESAFSISAWFGKTIMDEGVKNYNELMFLAQFRCKRDIICFFFVCLQFAAVFL